MADIKLNGVSHNTDWVASISWPEFKAHGKKYHYTEYSADQQEEFLKYVYEAACTQKGVKPVFEKPAKPDK